MQLPVTYKRGDMVKLDKSPTHSQQSVKFRVKPLKGPYFEIADFADQSDVHISSNDNKDGREHLASQSPEILTKTELISAVGHIWECASRSLARVQPKARFECSSTLRQKDNDLRYMVQDDSSGVLTFIDSGYFNVDLKSSGYFSCIMQKSLQFVRATRRMQYNPYNDHFIENLFERSGDDGFVKHDIWLKEKSIANVGILYRLMNRYGWMSQISVSPKPRMSASNEAKKIVEAFTSKAAVCYFCPVSEDEVSSSNVGTGYLNTCDDMTNLKDIISHGASDRVNMLRKASISFPYSVNLLHMVQNKHYATRMSTALSLGLHLDDKMSTLAPDCTHEPKQLNVEADDLLENEMRRCEKLNPQDELQIESCSSVTNKFHPLLAKQEHAVSGALAGIFVSLCLHPIDTVKTIAQSCQPGQKSICYIGQSVLSERGACASIATSFVFTPSERIKQQMQVNTKYQNCWNAVQKIIETGGLTSLYAGWGAVLCRNIPHSIIKFYTYESLKQKLMSSEPPNKQPNTSQTLLCGGLAGSTAALFSTPFDVVKTRLQTQMPESRGRYHGILSVLQDIRDHEGVRGLYRGLIPRLAMYMSQGALFFASYEFLKSFLSLELRQHKPEMLQHKQDIDDDPLSPQ
ncbi:uncharacterized protein LOC104907835 isoform X3 [Beta vulgaris subsp. vulgaris]|uniref:uncharacterized protein LOC104907835 isoform X3 n=1 Tax=Beta vulgaris subsp. vulgaris TaxID=3555 RepID=UPI0025474176|nr:uncharacterized protein LOC104907835 isoform X3 [Beta vulgaris subsp. vulgaris]